LYDSKGEGEEKQSVLALFFALVDDGIQRFFGCVQRKIYAVQFFPDRPGALAVKLSRLGVIFCRTNILVHGRRRFVSFEISADQE
jgi:hypothetical protein